MLKSPKELKATDLGVYTIAAAIRFKTQLRGWDMDTFNLFIRIDPEELVFLNGLIESYDDLAVIKTLDPSEGVVVIMVSPGREETARSILKNLANEIKIEFIKPSGKLFSEYSDKIYGP